MKAVGAGPLRVVATYAPVALTLATTGVVLGLCIGGLSPFAAKELLAQYAAVSITPDIQWQALGIAGHSDYSVRLCLLPCPCRVPQDFVLRPFFVSVATTHGRQAGCSQKLSP